VPILKQIHSFAFILSCEQTDKKQPMGCEAQLACSRPLFGVLGDFDQQSRSKWPIFGVQSGFISRSVRARLQVSVYNSDGLCHPG